MQKEVTCARCGKQGVIEVKDMRYLPEQFELRRMGWYWSDNNECFYCKPCERQGVQTALGKIVELCDDKGIEVRSLK